MQLLCSIQYRVLKENADDAYYELQNPKEQIQAFVFDGNLYLFPSYEIRIGIFSLLLNIYIYIRVMFLVSIYSG